MLDDCRRRLQHARHDAQMQQSIKRQQEREELRALVIATARVWDALNNESSLLNGGRPLSERNRHYQEEYYSRQPAACTRENLHVIEWHIKQLRDELRAHGPLDARLAE